MSQRISVLLIPILIAAMLYAGVWSCADASYIPSGSPAAESSAAVDSRILAAGVLPVVEFHGEVRPHHHAENAASSKRSVRSRLRVLFAGIHSFLTSQPLYAQRAQIYKHVPENGTFSFRVIISFIHHQNRPY
ncbi:MAG: hypothetical protein E7240_10465 [Lachnospiraceae bacterium]|nr:hypothetical protein [Lachnospiraceae bacterium]